MAAIHLLSILVIVLVPLAVPVRTGITAARIGGPCSACSAERW